MQYKNKLFLLLFLFGCSIPNDQMDNAIKNANNFANSAGMSELRTITCNDSFSFAGDNLHTYCRIMIGGIKIPLYCNVKSVSDNASEGCNVP